VFKSVVFIVNPVAGASSAGRVLTAVARRVRWAGGRARVLQTAERGDAAKLAASVDDDVDLLVVVGGDGTLREVAQGRAASPLPIALLPVGTENIVARNFGYRPTVESVWSCITRGRVREVDIGIVNGHCFLILVGVGFDAEVVARLARDRRGHITHMDYLWPIWRTFWSHEFPKIHVVADGHEVFSGRGLAFVGNMPRYSLGLRLLRDARDDDGLLDICVYPCGWQGKLIEHAFFTTIRRHVERRSVVYTRAERITIETERPARMQADGDLIGTTPARFEVQPGRAAFCMPPAR
jgi:diacylglycerol kinase (ATP)